MLNDSSEVTMRQSVGNRRYQRLIVEERRIYTHSMGNTTSGADIFKALGRFDDYLLELSLSHSCQMTLLRLN